MPDDLTLFLAAQVCLLLGFVVGRVTGDRSQHSPAGSGRLPLGTPVDTASKLKTIKINDGTFVTKVADSSLSKMGGDLGKSSSVDDDIGSSVSRLAQLKKNK